VRAGTGLLRSERQARNDQQAAHQQPDHPVRMPPMGRLQDKIGQIRKLSLTRSRAGIRIAPDATGIQERFRAAGRKNMTGRFSKPAAGKGIQTAKTSHFSRSKARMAARMNFMP